MEKFAFLLLPLLLFLVHTQTTFNIFGVKKKKEERKKAFLLQTKSKVVEIQNLWNRNLL